MAFAWLNPAGGWWVTSEGKKGYLECLAYLTVEIHREEAGNLAAEAWQVEVADLAACSWLSVG